jgi:hypothetical protein
MPRCLRPSHIPQGAWKVCRLVTFELFYQPDYLLPHREAAWQLMSEHLAEGADLADLEAVTHPRLRSVADALRRHARTLWTGSGAS